MSTTFYDAGLRFTCTQCSHCCRHEPGYVFLTESDFNRLVKAHRSDRASFFRDYCRVVDINGFKRISLIEKANYDCIFWEGNGCVFYNDRPVQCRTYPFWSPFLATKEDWDSLEASCPGVNNGQLHSKQEIEKQLEARNASRFLTDVDFDDLHYSETQ